MLLKAFFSLIYLSVRSLLSPEGVQYGAYKTLNLGSHQKAYAVNLVHKTPPQQEIPLYGAFGFRVPIKPRALSTEL